MAMRKLDLIRHLEAGVGATTSCAFDEQKPAAALLTRLSSRWDAVSHCRNKFPKRLDGSFTAASQDSLRIAAAAVFATMMSEVETFQRVLFAGCYEYSIHLRDFKPDEAFKDLAKQELISKMLAGYRGAMAPAGRIVVDGLGIWHYPEGVNTTFKRFVNQNLYDAVAVEDLKLMWQLRHSIVHTGGWITRPDSQKLPVLRELADQPMVVGFPFVDSATRRLYRTISASVSAYGQAYLARLNTTTPADARLEITDLFDVSGPRPAWV